MTTATQPTKATKATAKAPAKKPRAVRAKSNATKVAKPAKEPAVHAHIAAGVTTAKYTGPSSYINSNRRTKVMIGKTLEPGKVTDRAKGGLYALRETYKDGAFPAKGFDNGVLRDLAAAKLISLSGGQKENIDGKEYMLDGTKPLVVTITAAGMGFGKA